MRESSRVLNTGAEALGSFLLVLKRADLGRSSPTAFSSSNMARGGAGGPSGRSACQGDTLGIASGPLAVPWVPLGSDFRGSKMRRFRPQPRQPTVSGEEGLSPGGAVTLSAGLGELGELAQGPPSSPPRRRAPCPDPRRHRSRGVGGEGLGLPRVGGRPAPSPPPCQLGTPLAGLPGAGDGTEPERRAPGRPQACGPPPATAGRRGRWGQQVSARAGQGGLVFNKYVSVTCPCPSSG